nr:unnamed protein product [Digitaria exilis]
MASQHGILLAVGIISDHFGPLARRARPPPATASRTQNPSASEAARGAMASQHGILLAVGIISDHFGPLKVCDCLLRHSALSLQEIIRRLELSPGQVKNSLLVLIQHNCVQAYSATRAGRLPGSGDKMVTLYLAIFDNILHRLRFSKFLSVVRAEIPESEFLLDGLLRNGRLTFDQLVERTIATAPEGSTKPTREEIGMNFNKLVYAHYVERCPKPEPSFDPLKDEQPTATKKRGPKTVETLVLSLEQKVVRTAVLSDAERFSEIPYYMEGSSNANNDPHHAIAGDKFCAERKKAKMKVGTLAIWESFFEAIVTNNDTKTDLNKLVETCRTDEIESLVKKKHGQEAYTIFRLLLKQGCPVETDEITDRTILDKQVVHETLYKLWKDEYIDSERVPSAASGTGNTQFFVWRVRNTYREHYIDDLYHAALNLRQMVNYMAELLLEVSHLSSAITIIPCSEL